MVIFPLILALVTLQGPPETSIMLRQPAISPDGSQLAFIVNGDLYLVPAAGGEARLLVDDPVHASRPRFAPAGDRIAFTSLRSGKGDVFVVDLDSSDERRLTFHSAEDATEDWSPDGRWVYFSSSRADISGYTDLFAVPTAGGTPFPVSRARYEGEYNASVSPDGKWLAFNSNDRVRQWWRMGPRTDDATDVWIKPVDPGSNRFEKLTTFEGKDSWPLWVPDGRGVYLVTDEYSPDGTENLAYQGLTGQRRLITNFDHGRVCWPTMANDGTVAFERDFAIWTVREGSSPKRLEITLLPEEIDQEPRRSEKSSRVSEFHLDADHGRVVVVIHGDVFLQSLDSGGLVRVTETSQPERDVRLSSDGRLLAYVALRDGYFDVFAYDLVKPRETRLTSTIASERNLRFSPNGRRVAFVEGEDRLKIVDVDSREIVEIVAGLMVDPEIAWSPDGRLIAFLVSDQNWLSNVWLAPTDGRNSRMRLTDFPDVYFNGLSWTPDGRSLMLSTWTTRETRQVARVDVPTWTSDPDDERWGGTEPTGDVHYLLPANESLILDAVSRDGSKALLSGRSLGRRGLWRAAITKGGLEDFELVAPGRIAAADALEDGSVVFLSNGSLYRASEGPREPKEIELEAEFAIEPATKRLALFRQACLVFRDWFSGVSDDGSDLEALCRRYTPYVRGAVNDFDFMTAIRMMLGELNASHINVWGDPEADAESVGDLAVDFDGRALRSGRFVVSSVVPVGNEQGIGLQTGDEVTSLDGIELSVGVNLHQLLISRTGEQVSAKVKRDGEVIEVRLKVWSTDDVAEGRYREWVAENEALVDRLSDGRFAYVHRRHLGSGATEELRRQLGASALDKDGVVLDVRYNGGGIESARAISYLQRRAAHFNAFKDKVVAPGSLVHGIPVLDRPVVLLQNEQVLSDTESFSHQFRTLGVGPVVGTRTAGWNRGQRGYSLFDGTRLSVGAWLALTGDGEDMDRRGREPDVFVDRPLGETLAGIDSQLEAAVIALDEWIRGRERSGDR